MTTPPTHRAHGVIDPDRSGSVVAAGGTVQDLQRTSEPPTSLSAREIGRHRVAIAAGFVAGGGITATAGLPLRAIGLGPRTPSLKGMRMGVAAAGFRYMTAEPDERQQMVDQAQALLSQGQAMLESTGVLEKVFK